MKSCNWSSLA